MDKNNQIDDIVSKLDNFMGAGGGHMNIDVNEKSIEAKASVQTMNSNECAGQNMACKVPTLHVGIDDVEE